MLLKEATWAIWSSIKKHSLNITPTIDNYYVFIEQHKPYKHNACQCCLWFKYISHYQRKRTVSYKIHIVTHIWLNRLNVQQLDNIFGYVHCYVDKISRIIIPAHYYVHHSAKFAHHFGIIYKYVDKMPRIIVPTPPYITLTTVLNSTPFWYFYNNGLI